MSKDANLPLPTTTTSPTTRSRQIAMDDSNVKTLPAELRIKIYEYALTFDRVSCRPLESSLLARALAENPTGLDPRMQANPSGKPTPAIYFKQARRWKDTMADRDALLVNLSSLQPRRRRRKEYCEYPAGPRVRINSVDLGFDPMGAIDAEVQRHTLQVELSLALGGRQAVLRKTPASRWTT